MSADPTVLYVIGAAKSGTSWLYRYLRNHPDCHLRSIKELHFFDRAVVGVTERYRERMQERLRDLQAKFADADAEHLAHIGAEIADIKDWLDVLDRDGDKIEAYLSYLHGGGREDERLIGDVTPAYALLSVEEMQTMARLGPDTRFIYIMRDPVERLWSHVRMEVARRHPAEVKNFRVGRRLMRRVLEGKETQITDRGNYSATVEKLKKAVDPQRVLLAFTEEMLSTSGMRTICAFLGIRYVEPDVDRRVHEGPELNLRPGQRDAARELLAPQYDYVEQLFGRLPRSWQLEPAKV